MNKFTSILIISLLSCILGTALYPVVQEYVGWRLATTEQQVFQTAKADQTSCTAVLRNGIRKNEVVSIYNVTSERGGNMSKYRIDNHSNPTYLYAEAFKEYTCG